MAASATFALNAELCVRRARLAIVTPDLRHSRRLQAETPLIDLSAFGQPALSTPCSVSGSWQCPPGARKIRYWANPAAWPIAGEARIQHLVPSHPGSTLRTLSVIDEP